MILARAVETWMETWFYSVAIVAICTTICIVSYFWYKDGQK